MTAPGNIFAGGRVTADDIAGVAPLAVIKGADESVTSSTALQADNALFVPVLAEATYLFECVLDYEGGAQGSSDLKWMWALPAGAALDYAQINLNTSGNLALTNAGSGNRTAGTNGAGNTLAVTMTGTLTTSAVAGNLQLMWAQNTSSGTPTIIHAPSKLALWQVS